MEIVTPQTQGVGAVQLRTAELVGRSGGFPWAELVATVAMGAVTTAVTVIMSNQQTQVEVQRLIQKIGKLIST